MALFINFFQIISLLFSNFFSFIPSYKQVFDYGVETSEAQFSCTPIDVVFVIDQSLDLQKDDPSGSRILAVRWVINLLGASNLLECQDTVDRVAVITYSDEFSEPLGLTWIRLNEKSDAPFKNWSNEYRNIASKINPKFEGNRNIEAMKDALSEASYILRQAPDEGAKERKKVVVLISGGDGTPCTEKFPCGYEDVKKYKREIEDLLSKNYKGISLYVITFGADPGIDYMGTPYGFGMFWNTESSKYSGKYDALGKGGVEIARVLMKDLQSLGKWSRLHEVCGSVDIEPFTEYLFFSVFNNLSLSRVTFHSQGVNPPPEPTTPLFMDVNNESKKIFDLNYLFKYPVAGRWEFDAPCSSGDSVVFMQSTYVQQLTHQLVALEKNGQNVQQVSNPIPQYKEVSPTYDPERPYFLRLQVVDSSGEPFPNQLNYLADGKIFIKSPGGSEYTISTLFSNGYYTTIEPLPVNEVGDYSWKAELIYPSFGTSQEINKNALLDEGKYTVYQVEPFILQIESPSSGQVIPIHGHLFDRFMKVLPVEVRVRVKWRDEGEKVLNLEDALGDATLVKAIISYEDSSGKHEQERILYRSSSDPLLYRGEINNLPSLKGAYFLKVSLEGQYNQENFRYVEDLNSSKIEFIREDGLYQQPRFYIFSFIGFVFMIIILSFIYQHTNNVSGFLVFTSPVDNISPFEVIDLRKYYRRKIKISRDELIGRCRLLKDIELIEVKRNGFFWGDTQSILVKLSPSSLKERLEVSLTSNDRISLIDQNFLPFDVFFDPLAHENRQVRDKYIDDKGE